VDICCQPLKEIQLKRFIFLFVLHWCISAQTHVQIHRSLLNDRLLMELEETIIRNVIRIHNINEADTLNYTFVNHETFEELFTDWDLFTPDAEHLTVNSISITKDRERLFDFSSPYLPVKQVLIAVKSTFPFTTVEGKRIGFVRSSTQEAILEFLPQSCIFKSYDTFRQLEEGLLNLEIDLMMGDNVGVWSNGHTYIYKELDKTFSSSYGIMYKKGSLLRDRLDKYLRYYLKSKGFRRLVKNYFGKDISDYMIKQLRSY